MFHQTFSHHNQHTAKLSLRLQHPIPRAFFHVSNRDNGYLCLVILTSFLLRGQEASFAITGDFVAAMPASFQPSNPKRRCQKASPHQFQDAMTAVIGYMYTLDGVLLVLLSDPRDIDRPGTNDFAG
jgi:hypothetical protein